MKKFIQNTVAILVLCAVIFWFRVPIRQAYLMERDKLFPCDFPVEYSIGQVDNQFGISNDEFLLSIKKAESSWEEALGKQLFTYKPSGDLKISLIYDSRQETSNKLKNISFTLEDKKSTYESSKKEYDTLYSEYLVEKDNIKTKSEQDKLNQKINRLNELSKELSKSAENVNNQVTEYNNTIDIGLGSQFEEGIYFVGKDGKGINIYEFTDNDNLVRVLMHEMGHALSLEHSEDSKAIMYYKSSGGDLNLSDDDIKMLKSHCGIK